MAFIEYLLTVGQDFARGAELIFRHYDYFLRGIWMTIQLTAISLFFGGLLAIPMAFARANRHWLFNPLVYGFTYFFRGTPLLVQLYLIYNGLVQFSVVRDGFLWPFLREAYWCALLAFTLNTAAYTTEILRGAIEATPFGEIEAARACGMSRRRIARRIILPGAIRRALPQYSNEVIFMLHGTALASVVTLMDILGAGRWLNGRYYLAYEGFIAAGVLYACLTFIIVAIFRRLEDRYLAHLRPREHVSDTKAAKAAA